MCEETHGKRCRRDERRQAGPAGPGGPAGAVPDGNVRPGVPLTLNQMPGGDIHLSWGSSCGPQETDYAVYEGILGDFTTHTPVLCSTGGLTAVETFLLFGSSKCQLPVASRSETGAETRRC